MEKGRDVRKRRHESVFLFGFGWVIQVEWGGEGGGRRRGPALDNFKNRKHCNRVGADEGYGEAELDQQRRCVVRKHHCDDRWDLKYT